VQNIAYIRGIVQAGILHTCRNCEVGEGDQGEDEKTGRSSGCNGNRAPSLRGAQVHSCFLNKLFVCFAALFSKHIIVSVVFNANSPLSLNLLPTKHTFKVQFSKNM
jgi:hypothetical protein